MQVDNNGQRSLDDEIPNGGRLLDLSGGSRHQYTTYTAPNGMTVTSSCGLNQNHCTGQCSGSCLDYALAHLFDQSFSKSSCLGFFLSNCHYTKLTVDLKSSLFINHIRVYPYCGSTPANFRVSRVSSFTSLELQITDPLYGLKNIYFNASCVNFVLDQGNIS